MTCQLTTAYQRYAPMLVQKCRRMLGGTPEAEDVVQEAFLRLHQSGVAASDPRAVTAWLYRTSTRLAIDKLRARARRPRSEQDPEALSSRAGDPELPAEVRRVWAKLADQVPDAQLEAALLTRVDGLSQAEVAEVMRVHERTVRRLLVQFEAYVARVSERREA